MRFSRDKLRAAMDAAGIQEEELVVALRQMGHKASYPTVRTWLSKGSAPSGHLIPSLARVLDVPVEDLYDQLAAAV